MSALTRRDVWHRGPRSKWRGGEGLGSGARYRARSRGSWSATAWLRRKWRLTAARIRTSSGVTQLDLGPGSRMAHRMPWLGLLLWALACAGLFVSLLV
jgi:hypothetical protein